MIISLLHKPVLIHPELRTDSLQMQGKVGFISTFNLDKDDFFVDFKTGKTGLYSASALLVARSHNDVYTGLMGRRKSLEILEFKDLMHISLLLQNAGYTETLNALGLALRSPNVLQLATQPLTQQLHASREINGTLAEQQGFSR
jgi:hypothetical protein